MLETRQQRLYLVGAALIIAIGFIIWFGVSRANKVKITINVLPTYSKTTLDGRLVRNKSTHYVKPGEHRVKVVAKNFTTEDKKISVSSPEHFDFILLPADETGQQWVNDNAELYEKVEERGGAALQEKGMEMASKQPIIELLPYIEDDGLFKIGYLTPDGTADSFQLTIYGSTAFARQLALSQIRSWGYDPADYNVRFMDFTNPLQEF